MQNEITFTSNKGEGKEYKSNALIEDMSAMSGIELTSSHILTCIQTTLLQHVY